MPTWIVIVLVLAVFAACIFYLGWAIAQLLQDFLRRRELKHWEAGLLERLAATGSDESRLDELRRLHGIVDSRLRRLGTTAPTLRSSLDKAMYLRTTQPEFVRQKIGRRKLPSVSAITRLMDLLDADNPEPEVNEAPTVPAVDALSDPAPAAVAASDPKSRRKAWRLISENPLIATVVGGLTVALVLYVIHSVVGGGDGGPAGPSTAQLLSESNQASRAEQAGAGGARTFTVPAGADEGPRVRPDQHVTVACRVYKPEPESVMPDGYWYRLASPPWRGRYYAPANSFWNGDRPGHRPYIHDTDFAVPDC
jgi:hypothetical protein